MRKQISLTQLNLGEQLAQDIYNSMGNLLLRKGVIITEEFIVSLKSKGVENVYINIDSEVSNLGNVSKVELAKYNNLHIFNKAYKEMLFQISRTALRGKYNKELQKDLVHGLADILKIVFATNPTQQIDLYLKCKNFNEENYYTYESHSLNTGILCAMIGQWLNLNMEEIIEVAITGCLHDIGKNRIPQSILDKKGKLTHDEWKIIKTHPVIGASILTRTDWVKPKTIIGVLRHHERLDGSGYPHGCLGSDIPLYARIVAVSGAFDTMTTNRPYASATEPYKAIGILKEQSFGQLDTKITRLLYEKLLEKNINKYIELSNGEKGKVVYSIIDNRKQLVIETKLGYFDLTKKSSPYIKKIL